MKYLLFAGARDTGKSQSVYNLANSLHKSYKPRTVPLPKTYAECQCILENGTNVILVQTYTDTVQSIKDLKRVRDSNPDLTHIITSIRNEGDYMRSKFNDILDIEPTDYLFEIPLGKVVTGKHRQTNIKWYLEKIKTVAKEIANHPPFNF